MAQVTVTTLDEIEAAQGGYHEGYEKGVYDAITALYSLVIEKLKEGKDHE